MTTDHQTSDLETRIRGKRDDLIALTQALIQIPTLNPPGENYREICEFLAARLGARGFATEFIRAHGTPGDSDKYPRWNLVARRDGHLGGPCVHFNSHTDVVEVGLGWSKAPFGGELEDGRIYGRGACDMAPSRFPGPPMKKPAAMAASLIWRRRVISPRPALIT